MRSLHYLIAVVLLCAAPKLHAAPCQPDTLDAYLQAGFSCTVSDDRWRFSDFRFRGFGFTAESVPSPLDIFVTPFGGTQVAGLRFDILEPLNFIAVGDRSRTFNLAYDVLSAAGIVNAAQETVNAFVGQPGGGVDTIERLCLDGFFDGLTFDCSSGNKEIFGGIGIQTEAFARSIFLGVRNQWTIASGDELPGGARLDAVINRFRVIPEPPVILLMIAGLLGVGMTQAGCMRRASKAA